MDDSFANFRANARGIMQDRRERKLSEQEFRAALRKIDADTQAELSGTLGPERAKSYVDALDDNGDKLLGTDGGVSE